MKDVKRTLIIVPIVGSLGYFVPLYFGFIWLGLGLLLFSAAIFIGLLVVNSRQYFESKWAYRITAGIALVVIITHALLFVVDNRHSNLVQIQLFESSKTVSEILVKQDVQSAMYIVLRTYELGDYNSILLATNAELENRLTDEGEFIPDFELWDKDLKYNEHIDLYYTSDKLKDEFKVIVIINISGRDVFGYPNYNGQTGLFEMEFSLTKEGVFYEVLN